MNEETSIELAKKGDLFAFNELVLAYQQPVYNLALRMIGDEDLAADIAQETFISAFGNLHQFSGGSFRNWLLRSAANRSIDELRRQKRHPSQPLDRYNADGEEIEDPTWMKDHGQDPTEEVERRELAGLIQRCMNELTDEHRLVIILVDVFEMDYAEAQVVIAKPLGTLKSRLIRAREAIRRCLLGLAEQYSDFSRYKRESV